MFQMSEAGSSSRTNNETADRTKKDKPVPKMAKSLSTSAKRMQKELGEITIDPPPNCRYLSNVTALNVNVKTQFIAFQCWTERR